MYNLNVHIQEHIMTSIPFTQARANLSDLIDQSNHGETVFISQRGQTTAVLLSVPEYQKLNGEKLNLMQKFDAWREEFSNELEDSNDFSPERDQSAGRDFEW